MKRYISPETSLVAELDAAQSVMQLVTSPTKARSDSAVLTKRQVWDDEEEWED